MKVTLARLADFASITLDGKLNILGIFGMIAGRQFPLVHKVAYLALELELSASEVGRSIGLGFVVIGPDGEEVGKAEGKLESKGKIGSLTRKIPFIVQFSQLKFPKPGDYAVCILIQGEERHRVPLEVRQSQPRPSDG